MGHGRSPQEETPGICASAREASQSATRNPQSAIDQGLARSFLYRFLAKAYEYPTEEGWRWLSEPAVQTVFWSSATALAVEAFLLRAHAEELVLGLQARNFEPFLQDYIAVFGHAARGSCPLNEIEY